MEPQLHFPSRTCPYNEAGSTVATSTLNVEDVTVPKSWSARRERQYEHIKEGYEDRGVSEDEAEERAARTVNKERAEAGEAKSSKRSKQR